MASIQLFTPMPTGTVSILASSTSTAVTLATGVGLAVSIKNVSATSLAYVVFGTAGVTCTASSGFPIAAGERVGVTINPDIQTTVAVVAATTAQVYFTRGDGV